MLKTVLQKITGQRKGELYTEWSYDTKSSIFSSAEIIGDKILIGTKSGILHCLSSHGKLLWEFSLKASVSKKDAMFLDTATMDAFYASPIANAKMILCATESGLLAALNHDGKLLWKSKANGAIRSKPIFADVDNDGKDEIIFGARDKYLYVIKNNGHLLWKYKCDAEIESSPAVSGDIIVCGTNSGNVYCLNCNGELIWTFKTKDKIITAPIMIDDRIYVTSMDNTLYTLNQSGKLEWKFLTDGRILSSPKVIDADNDSLKEIFLGSCDDKIYALSPNGQMMWQYETGFWIGAPIQVLDIDGDGKNEVIAGSYDKKIYVLDAGGTFAMDFVPGISGLVDQPGAYSDFITTQPGKLIGTKLWEYYVGGIITGMSSMERKIIISTKEGKLIQVAMR